ncbi:MAG: hypothetical protein A2X82_06270 [Geobacteraceae bacterium GWC2_55_20]|nr:MAG: hypothetical protein A2X82_06270 [Geobacteraceae bacterium GWC2_55_20]OGU21415.1 MAG: hypothetical protein A2X85_02645 [Geobacteraceae bacterium GWF2_54_21]
MLCRAFDSIFRLRRHLLILVAVSLLAGIFAYRYCEFSPLTLVLEAKTLRKGVGTVTVEQGGSRGSVTRTFEIQDDQGQKTMYLVELPAGSLKSVKVAPLAPSGQFSLDRIILSNDATVYSWDEWGQCSRRTLRQGVLTREACDADSPVLAATADSSVVISSLSLAESGKSQPARFMVALVAALGVFGGGFWLFRPNRGSSSGGVVRSFAVRSAWLVLVMLYAYQLYLVNRYAVDLPYEDEWDYFKASALSQEFSWSWLLAFHNEHRIVLTKLLAWVNLKFFGLDFALQKILNMILFGGLLVVLVRFKDSVVGRDSFPIFPLFLVFLLSPIARENHLWAFQSQFHLVLLFSVAALITAYNLKIDCSSAWGTGLLMLLAMYTFSAGAVFAVVYLSCISVYVLSGIARGEVGLGAGRRFLLIVGSLTAVGMLLLFHGYVTPPWPPPRLYPTNFRFWDYYMNIISFGFGFSTVSILPGIVCLLWVLCPPILLLWRRETRWQPATWQIVTALLSILAVLAAISMGRGNFGEPKTSRYAEIGFMLIPYAALAWWLVVKDGGRWKIVPVFLWFFCFAGYFNDWSADKYAEAKQIDLYNLECVEGYFTGIGDGVCQGRTTPQDLDRAKAMGARFTRQFNSNRDGGL